jgi:two-component system, cell cycle sensor histidine kinase and response regulator CckA
MATATVLVVDDEPAVLQFICHALDAYGYKAVPAADARQALEAVRNAGPVFDLVLSDVVMPGMHGPELAREIKRLSPATSILLMSGNAGLAELPAGSAFLEKPFALQALLDSVERALRSDANPRK